MKRVLAFALTVAVFSFGILVVSADDKDEKPKYTIKDVMKTCMKGGLCKKVAGGQASDDEKKQLLEMFQSLSKNKPPKGEAESWKSKTEALVKAAQEAVDGKEGAGAALGKAANCAECHKAHKG